MAHDRKEPFRHSSICPGNGSTPSAARSPPRHEEGAIRVGSSRWTAQCGCPVYVDSSRPDRAHTGHSSTAWRQGLIDLSWRRQRGPQGQPSPLKGTSRFRTRPALITRRCHCGERDRTHSRLFETLTHFAACLGDSSRTFVGRHPGLVLYRRAGRLPKVTEATARFIRPAGQAAAR